MVKLSVLGRLESGGKTPFNYAEVSLSWNHQYTARYEHHLNCFNKTIVLKINCSEKADASAFSDGTTCEDEVSTYTFEKLYVNKEVTLKVTAYFDEGHGRPEKTSLSSDLGAKLKLNNDHLSDIKVVVGQGSD
jgi:hypothetical protein